LSGHLFRTLVIVVLLTLLLPLATTLPPEEVATAAPGDLTDMRWTLEDSPFILNSSIEIDPTVRLTIEAGVIVRFDEDVGIQVRGELRVEGSSELPVMFVSNVSGPIVANYWADLRLMPSDPESENMLTYAVFEGADTGLLVSGGSAIVDHCSFSKCRYGVLARGDATVEATDCDFVNNSVLGLEWETGAGGKATSCTFSWNVVGVYCYENVTPIIQNCDFFANYHHLSFARGGNATIVGCDLGNTSAEAIECWWNSSPFFKGVVFEEPGDAEVFLRENSRPRFEGGTSVSLLDVVSLDVGSYAVSISTITIYVESDQGKSLEGANVTLSGRSGDEFTNGATGADGTLFPAMMSSFTVGGNNNNDMENPHEAVVEWRGHTQTYKVTPRDLDKDQVLTLELVLSSPEPSGEGWLLNIVLIMIIGLVLMVVIMYRTRER
jgi:hypothetical protein